MTIIEELKTQIRAMPDKIKEASDDLDTLRDSLRKRKAEYEVALSNAYLVATGSVMERKAKSEVACVGEHQKFLEAQAAVDRAESALKYGENVFVSLRKEASMVEAELKNLNN